MSENKKELAVAALRHGTVIDHVPSEVLFKVVHILGLEHLANQMTIGNNLSSGRMGSKGIIKVADMEFPEEQLNRIAIIAPHARVNVIRDFEVAEKRPVTLPDSLIGIVKCRNPKCITNNEPMLTRFEVVDHDDVTLRCHYCNQTVKSHDALIV